MTRFPVLKLPFLAFENVLKFVDFADLIDLTTCSKKCRLVVSQMKHSFTRMEISVNKRDKHLNVFSGTQLKFYWEFNPYGESCYQARVRKIDKMKIRWQKPPIKRISRITSKHPKAELSMQVIITYLIRIFRIPITKLSIFTDGVNQYPFQFDCESFELSGNSGPLPTETLRFLLENVKASRKIDIGMMIDNSLSYQSIDCDEIVIRYAEWMTGDCLLSSRFSKINLECCTLSEHNVISFINKWMNSNDKKFEELIVSKHCWHSECFQRLETKPWSSAKRARNYRLSSNKAIDLSNALDFERSDGLLASVLITYFKIYFVVWHDRFPDTDGLQNCWSKIRQAIELNNPRIEALQDNNQQELAEAAAKQQAEAIRRFAAVHENGRCTGQCDRILEQINVPAPDYGIYHKTVRMFVDDLNMRNLLITDMTASKVIRETGIGPQILLSDVRQLIPFFVSRKNHHFKRGSLGNIHYEFKLTRGVLVGRNNQMHCFLARFSRGIVVVDSDGDFAEAQKSFRKLVNSLNKLEEV